VCLSVSFNLLELWNGRSCSRTFTRSVE